ncbi:MAG: hypothetical protein HY562_05190 [Ignavibacteriales bacterium]|nr:hypothetical protein [Ignavibacteriales bacterium]
MGSKFRIVHLIVGMSTFLVFLLTGAYMRTVFPDAYSTNESIRFLYRANHVYILFSGLLNILLGIYLVPREIPLLQHLQHIGSWLVAGMTAVFVVAFIFEPVQASASRPITVSAVFSTAIGVGLHVLALFWKRRP